MIKFKRTSKHLKAVFILALALILLSQTFLTLNVKAQTENGYYIKHFEWDYNGDHWEWNLTIPKSLYEEYKSVSLYSRVRNGPAGYGFLTTTDDYYLQLLAEKLNETTVQQGYGSYDQVSFVLAFVQSLPYTSDNVTSGYDEYPRFPIETLVDEGGDCEDTSILLATLTILLGYGTVYINPPNHYAVGILGDNIQGSYWTYNNQSYYYSETTGNGFKIGQIPDEFKGQSAHIFEINSEDQYVPNYRFSWSDQPSPSFSPSPTPTFTSPIMAQLSFNAFFSQPLFLILITIAIAVSVTAVIFSSKKRSRSPYLNPTATSPTNANPEGTRFCVFCGESNKDHAVFCEKCGQKIRRY